MNMHAISTKVHAIKNTVSLIQKLRIHFLKCRSFSIFTKSSQNSSKFNNSDSSNQTNDGDDKSDKRCNKVERSRFYNLIESQFYGVKQFGKLEVRIPFSVSIASLDPQYYPEMNKAKINIFYIGRDKDTITPNKLSYFTKMYDLSVDLKDNTDMVVSAECAVDNLPLCCQIQIPLQFDIQIENEGDLHISNMECQNISISHGKSLGGVCLLTNTKTANTTIYWKGGDIISEKVLQGNMCLTNRGKGKILADKFQGQSIKCETEAGEINISSVYSDECSFVTKSADVRLGSCHGLCHIQVGQGNVIMNSVDGDLSANVQIGSVKAHLSRHGQVNVRCKNGDINLEVPDSTATTLSLEGNTVECDERLKIQNKEERPTDVGVKYTGCMASPDDDTSICAVTEHGKVQLLCRDWMASISEKFQQER